MTCELMALRVDADDPLRLARFWSGLLGWEMAGGSGDGVSLVPGEDMGFPVRFQPAQETEPGPAVGHLHLTSTSLEDQRRTVARSLRLGARHADAGQRPAESHVVLADPEGNNFCVIGPGDRWLAGCGFLAELTCDGSREAGYFWSRALGWPLVWDEGPQTAIRSPRGGPKISWDSWDAAAVTRGSGNSRLRFDLAPPPGGDQQAEVSRLVSLGAARIGPSQDEDSRVVMADPDGRGFRVLPPR